MHRSFRGHRASPALAALALTAAAACTAASADRPGDVETMRDGEPARRDPGVERGVIPRAATDPEAAVVEHAVEQCQGSPQPGPPRPPRPAGPGKPAAGNPGPKDEDVGQAGMRDGRARWIGHRRRWRGYL